MALQVADRVWEYTSTTGTGTLTLAGAVPGYQSFAAIGNGNQTYYTILNGSIWEVGIGTYTSSGTTLSRDTVLSNSSGNTSPITLVGSSSVFCDYPAEKAVIVDASGNTYAPNIGGTTASAGTFTTITGQTEVLKGTGTNLLQQSQALATSPWANAFNTATNNAVTAPDLTTTGTTFTADGSNNYHFLSQTISSSINQCIFSVYLKYTNNQYVWLQIRDNSGSNGTNCIFDIQNGTLGTASNTGNGTGAVGTITAAGNGYYRCSLYGALTANSQLNLRIGLGNSSTTISGFTSSNTFSVWGSQVEVGTTANTYIPTTTTAIYGTPTLSFSGVAGLGLQSDGSLYVSPAGTGALQAQKTDSTSAGGNARGANAVDWQMARTSASQVASNTYTAIGGGYYNSATGFGSVIAGGSTNTTGGNSTVSFIGGGLNNTVSQFGAGVVAGKLNTAAGWYNLMGGGYQNSGTSSSTVTTQSGTMNATTAVTLSGSNANIKVGQLITGTSINSETYVAAISGTSLTLSQNASGSSTSTLSFYTPHGVVVGGGNNQATGSYSFIGGGGDAGTAANRNVASGDWSFVGGGRNNTASGNGAFIGGGGVFSGSAFANLASGAASVVVGGISNTSSGQGSAIVGGYANSSINTYSFIGAGQGNISNGTTSAIMGGSYGTTRLIIGNHVFPACVTPIASTVGISQSALLVLAVQTTDATATVLRSDANAASGTNQVILPNNSAYYFTGTCIANVTGAASGAAWSFEGAIMRGANAASTVLIGTPVLNRVAVSSGASLWSIALTADTTNGGLAVTVTGVASTTIRWVSKIETTEVTY